MQNLVRLIVAWVGLSVASHAIAAPVHTVTWTGKNVDPGTKVAIAGQQFVLVRVPFRDLGSSAAHYAVSFLAPVTPQIGPTAILFTGHSTDPIKDPIQIDGFDAAITVSDGRTYSISPDFTNPLNLTTKFSVTAEATCTVVVKIGQTILNFNATLQTTQQPPTDIGESLDAVPSAEWDAYVHPTTQVNGCNKWVDYIRIKKVP